LAAVANRDGFQVIGLFFALGEAPRPPQERAGRDATERRGDRATPGGQRLRRRHQAAGMAGGEPLGERHALMEGDGG
jgi:hypothetical protein